MTLGPLAFVGQLFHSLWSRVIAGSLAAMAFYQFGCDQFGWPTLPVAWQLTGAKLPWWGWLLILQATLVVALFEFVRRSYVPLPATSESASKPLDLADIGRQQIPAPDLTFDELVKHVVKTQVHKSEIDQDAKMAVVKTTRIIVDTISLKGMAVWGRIGGRPIERIPDRYWKVGTLDIRNGTLAVPMSGSMATYDDLRFYANEVFSEWPRAPQVADDAGGSPT